MDFSLDKTTLMKRTSKLLNKTIKYMKNLLLIIITALTISASAQSNTFVRGNLDIAYKSRIQSGVAGVKDSYSFNVNICNSAVFRGSIEHTPIIVGLFDRVSQPSTLSYNIDLDVVNPANPSQVKTDIGRIYGSVPITMGGLYDYDNGTLKVYVNKAGIDSRFTGKAQGKPIYKSSGIFSSLQKEALTMFKSVNGKTTKTTVTNYDKMEFNNHVIPAGPVQSYTELIVNGELVYDYDKSIWFFRRVTMSYSAEGKNCVDKLSGDIRWNKAKKQYEFDVRFNETPPNEAAAFAVSNESSFFEEDNTVTALKGTMVYKDSMSGNSVVASKVAVDLTGNKINKYQAMNMFKLVFLSCIVPFNAE